MSLIHQALEKLEHEKKEKVSSSILELQREDSKERASLRASRGAAYGIVGILIFSFFLGLGYHWVHTSKVEGVKGVPSKKEGRPALMPPRSKSENRFSLTGITRMGSEWTAIVNNQLVRVGDSVDGAVVETIQQESVVLKRQGEAFALSLYGESGSHFTRLDISG